MKYHALKMCCPGCQICCKTEDVSFRADRMVMLEGTCPKCRKQLYMELTVEEAVPHDESLIPGFNLEAWQPKGKPN